MKKTILCAGVVFLAFCAGWLFLCGGRKTVPAAPVVIVLSPHYDDAVLSLGGFLAEYRGEKVVATFFTAGPDRPVSGKRWDALSGFKTSAATVAARTDENRRALVLLGAKPLDYHYLDFQYRRAENRNGGGLTAAIERNIEALIGEYGKGPVFIYGPAYFGDDITHPDHKILHDAFLGAWRRYAGSPLVAFFIYEDTPYIEAFDQSGRGTLREFLSLRYPALALKEQPIELTAAGLSRKRAALDRYLSQVRAFSMLGNAIASTTVHFDSGRCKKTEPEWAGCEVVYRLERQAASGGH